MPPQTPITTPTNNQGLASPQPSNPSPEHKLETFIRQHRKLSLFIFIIIALVLSSFIIFAFVHLFNSLSNPEAIHETEDAPHISIEHEYLIESATSDFFDNEALTDDILFNLRLVLMNSTELATAPTDNDGNREYIASIVEDSYTELDTPSTDQALFTMNLEISDDRAYKLYLLFDYTYQSEYAIIVLDRTDNSDANDYVIALTSYAPEYYAQIIAEADDDSDNISDNADNSSSDGPVDHITGAKLNPLPDSAITWIKSLKLTNPEYIYSTLPALH